MADNHGNTPAAWTAVTVAMLGFLVGAAGLLFTPVDMTIFWIGAAITVGSLLIYVIMAKLGFNGSED